MPSLTWPEAVERVAAVLRDAAVEARIEELADETPSAREAAAAIGCEPAAIVKSLVFVCDGAFVLALVPGDRRADEAAVAAATSTTTVRIARAEEVKHATGFEPGGVAPFPRRAVADVVIDRGLLAHELVWVGAGSPSHMAALPPAELVRLARARPFDLAAHG
jgi:prolyl-tRNA editing enzyme YbaK/EbsC (Cys-tRNA(Pro) deacylase)